MGGKRSNKADFVADRDGKIYSAGQERFKADYVEVDSLPSDDERREKHGDWETPLSPVRTKREPKRFEGSFESGRYGRRDSEWRNRSRIGRHHSPPIGRLHSPICHLPRNPYGDLDNEEHYVRYIRELEESNRRSDMYSRNPYGDDEEMNYRYCTREPERQPTRGPQGYRNQQPPVRSPSDLAEIRRLFSNYDRAFDEVRKAMKQLTVERKRLGEYLGEERLGGLAGASKYLDNTFHREMLDMSFPELDEEPDYVEHPKRHFGPSRYNRKME